MAHVDHSNSSQEAVWFLDSGCSNHMTVNKQWFMELDEEYRHSVKLGNNMKMAVMGKGSTKMQIEELKQVASDVYYIPDLKNNLLSIGQLQEKCLVILIRDGACKVYHKKRRFIMQTHMTVNRMFVLLTHMTPQSSTCFKVATEDITKLWYQRFGHLSYKNLQTLQHKKTVKRLPQLKSNSKPCTSCMMGKHRNAIPRKSQRRALERLQLMHANICGHISSISNGGKMYVLNFVDDYSRKLWVCFLTEK